MKTNLEHREEDALLAAVLGDENWQAASASLKTRAMAKYQRHQSLHKITRWTSALAMMVVAIGLAAQWSAKWSARQISSGTEKKAVPVESRPQDLTDDQLLAAFPEGSCFLAEVEGKKRLIFFDPDVERQYVWRVESEYTLNAQPSSSLASRN